MHRLSIAAALFTAAALSAVLTACGSGSSAAPASAPDSTAAPAQTTAAAPETASALPPEGSETTPPAQTTTAAPETSPAETTVSTALSDNPAVQKLVKASYQDGYTAGYADGRQENGNDDALYRSITAEGSFTATVRALMPDYVSEPDTVQAAVLQLFQDDPVFIRLGRDICSGLTVGQTYTFVVDAQEMYVSRTMLLPDRILDSRALRIWTPVISEVRAPLENEAGLDCWRLCYEIN